jgi:hypothetical protein
MQGKKLKIPQGTNKKAPPPPEKKVTFGPVPFASNRYIAQTLRVSKILLSLPCNITSLKKRFL